jgi:hypothetical protein
MVYIKLLTKRARRVSIKSRSRQHVDKSADLLIVSNFARPSAGRRGCLQIGKAPAIIMLAFRQNCTSVSRLNMSCLVKLKNPAVQFDIQSADTDGKLGDVGVLCFVPHRLIADTTRHV